MVEHWTFNPGCTGSSPVRRSNAPWCSGSTSDFDSGGTGTNPVGVVRGLNHGESDRIRRFDSLKSLEDTESSDTFGTSYLVSYGLMAELVDAWDLKSQVLRDMRVQLPLGPLGYMQYFLYISDFLQLDRFLSQT